MISPFFGELMGTFVLIVLGLGTSGGVLLRDMKSENAGWLAVTAGWGFAVFCGVVTAIACGSPGAHLNPAVTIAVAIKTGSASQVPAFLLAQFLGAAAGAFVIWLTFMPHWKVTEDPTRKLAVFCTIPAIRNPFWNMIAEMVPTLILLLVVGCIGAHSVASVGPAPGLAPYLVGILVWAIGLGLGGSTGYAINPARDLAPRLMHTLLPIPGKGPSDWSYAWVPLVGPLLGAVIAGLFLRFTGI